MFERPTLVKELSEIAAARGARATTETVKRDVEVLLRSYAPRTADTGEDASEPLLAELGLILAATRAMSNLCAGQSKAFHRLSSPTPSSSIGGVGTRMHRRYPWKPSPMVSARLGARSGSMKRASPSGWPR